MASSSNGIGVEEGGPPSFPVEASRVCMFCDTSVISGGEEDVGRFFKLLGRFIGEVDTLAKFGGRSKLLGREKKWIGCCVNCGLIVSSFCEAYHQLKCLELRLEWKLETLVNVMKFANRGAARRDRKNNNFKFIRAELIRTCTSRKLSRSLPRVRLERNAGKSRHILSSSSLPVSVRTPKLTPKATSSGSEVISSDTSSSVDERFLGRAAAITIHATTTTQPELVKNSFRSTDKLQISSHTKKISSLTGDLDESGDISFTSAFEPEDSTDFSQDFLESTVVPTSRETNKGSLHAIALPSEVQSLSQIDSESEKREESMEALTNIHDSVSVDNFQNNPGDKLCGQLEAETETLNSTPIPATEESTPNTGNDMSTVGVTAMVRLNQPKHPMNVNEQMLTNGDDPSSSKYSTSHSTVSIVPGTPSVSTVEATEFPRNRGYNLREKRNCSYVESEMEEHTVEHYATLDSDHSYSFLTRDAGDPSGILDNSTQISQNQGYNLKVGRQPQMSDSSNCYSSSARSRRRLPPRDPATGHFRRLDTTATSFICSVCQSIFKSSWHLKRHFQVHEIQRPNDTEVFRCDLCPAYFINVNQLQTHKAVKHFKKQCPVCGRWFLLTGLTCSLYSHLKHRHPEFCLSSKSTFICDFGKCQKQSPSKAALDSHQKSH